MPVHGIPVDAYILVHEDVAKSGDGSESAGELGLEHSEFRHTHDGIVSVGRFAGLLSRDDLVADVDAALSSDLQIPLRNVPQEGILVELAARPIPERP